MSKAPTPSSAYADLTLSEILALYARLHGEHDAPSVLTRRIGWRLQSGGWPGHVVAREYAAHTGASPFCKQLFLQQGTKILTLRGLTPAQVEEEIAQAEAVTWFDPIMPVRWEDSYEAASFPVQDAMQDLVDHFLSTLDAQLLERCTMSLSSPPRPRL